MSDKQIIHYGSFDRGIAVVLGEGMKAVYFDTTPVPFENDTVYVASLDVSKEEDRKRREALEKSKPFRLGKIRYIPSQAELEAAAKRKAQDDACEAMKNDLGSGLYTLNLEGLNHKQLMELADKIGAKNHSENTGKALAPMPLRQGIAGRLELKAPYGGSSKKDDLPEVSEIINEIKSPKSKRKVK